MIADLERPGRFPPGVLSGLKSHSWTQLCSYTHTGYRQIGARLTTEGLGYNYEDAEVLEALNWANQIALMSSLAFANLANNEPLSIAVLKRLE